MGEADFLGVPGARKNASSAKKAELYSEATVRWVMPGMD